MDYEVVNMKDRIVKIMERERMGQAQFASAIGIQRAAMSHIISGRNNPSLDVMLKILHRYPQLNPDWLLFGKGEMLRSSDSSVEQAEDQAKTPPQLHLMADDHVEVSQAALNTEREPLEEQMAISVEKTSKTVSRIMVFYSDNTYDTFVPERVDEE
ncbi:helix-turn-helix transcriptional regulator [Parabacteroides sp. AD58]|uniref:Helix-turn-helix transcriptional regulator n=1 Tax=Parabacteroides absconsus TaxID=2951805 RepID=A0ABZ2IQM4_9BACT|nr:helix-turn-helix transcriptional regulator [Parabacteroides sp. AD58]MCM6900892.1 helix-turn-helix domain-containing protein [Parabacteroides sp. AD58]